ncbi:DUF551 domain-containing protein [Escherichia coli]|uniref:DUF551 domain-containing protein n=2 Tax=Escherichia coli TaxID=562 RepID=UPI00145C1A98|nr:DUF551 domain-containing protein [Escherichia coli]EKH7308287.1 DUF551 domain-containing protein [Shigella flexneri]EFB6848481.1 DUF551 domain-containing protein [Escherichia coli]EFK6224868.1 DUF551 domain-containing protein [Escherichia coli]EFN5490734.1 DUF551 domain-containing protein [Escherichia coli]EIQ9722402.1 DUF551 domain-containing protein [Escherichia coli]
MTTITKERLLTIKQWRETYGPGINVVLPAEEAEELARIALASLEAEPVGAFHIAEQQVDGTSDYLKDGEWPIDNGIIEVYAAPPVPVVPAALPENDDEDGHDIDYLEPSEVYALGRTAGWNACRAAMLHGKYEQPQNAQQNIPENIPGGNSPGTPDSWISCSDRMPEETGDIIVVSDGIVMSGISYSRRDGFYIAALEYDDDEPIDGVTHWMPLPEAPQEVK